MGPFPFKEFQRQLLLKMMLLQHNHSSRLYWMCQQCVKRQIVMPNSRLLSTFDSIRSNIFSLDICQTFSKPSHTLPILHPYSYNKKTQNNFCCGPFFTFLTIQRRSSCSEYEKTKCRLSGLCFTRVPLCLCGDSRLRNNPLHLCGSRGNSARGHRFAQAASIIYR